jgi:cyclin H
MCDPADSSQLKAWLFSQEDLDLCRTRANRVARKHISSIQKRKNKEIADDNGNSSKSSVDDPLIEFFARDFAKKKIAFLEEEEGPMQTEDSNDYLTPSDEALLVSFYTSKLPSLIGPQAQLPRLRRESKIPATAATLMRRFYLSNSVMIHDPKTIMVSAAFLASKVEDAMTDVRKKNKKKNLRIKVR